MLRTLSGIAVGVVAIAVVIWFYWGDPLAADSRPPSATVSQREPTTEIASGSALGSRNQEGVHASSSRSETQIVVRARYRGADTPISEAFLVDWTADLQRLGESRRGVPVALLRERARSIPTDADGRVRIHGSSNARLVAVRAANAAPAGCLVESSAAEIVLDLPTGNVYRARVVDPSNQALAGAKIVVRYEIFHALSRDPEQDPVVRAAKALFEWSGVTDPEGRVDLAFIATGLSRVWAQKEGYSENLVIGANLAENPDAIETHVLSPLAARVTGIVFDAGSNEPLPNASIEVANFVNDQLMTMSGGIETGKDGRFQAAGIEAEHGEVVLHAIRDGYATAFARIGLLRDGESREVEFRLERSAPFHGLLVDTANQPIANARVSAADLDHEPGGLEEALTNAQGEFQFRDLPRDKPFVLVPQKSGFPLQWTSVPSPWTQPFIVRLKPLHSLRGRLVADGYPLVNPRVRVAKETSWLRRQFEQWVDAAPDTGEFVVPDVEGGRYFVDAVVSGYAPCRIVNLPVSDSEDRPDIEVRLERGPRMSGRVVDRATGEPLPETILFFGDPRVTHDSIAGPLEQAAMTDERGAFVIEAISRKGRVVLITRRPGYATAVLDFETLGSESGIEREIALDRESTFELRATRPDGQPARRFSAVLSGPDRVERSQETEGGVLQFSRLPRGRYRVNLTLADSESGVNGLSQEVANIEIEPGSSGSLSFVGGGTLRGRVIGAGFHDRIGRFAIDARKRDEPSQGIRFYDDSDWGSGEFRLVGMPPGSYEVTAYTPDGDSNTGTGMEVQIAEGAATDVTFDVSDRALLGRIVDPRGRPVNNVRIALRARGGTRASAEDPGTRVVDPWRRAFSDPEGRFRITGFAEGTQEYVLTKDGYAHSVGEVALDSVDPTRGVEWVIEEECRVSVFVVDASGEPLTAARVFANIPATRNVAGAPTFEGDEFDSRRRHVLHGLGTGTYVLHAELHGYLSWSGEIETVGGSELDLKLALRELVPFSLRLRDAHGAPLADTAVELRDLASGESVRTWMDSGRLPSASLSTDTHGELALPAVAAGRYRVVAPGIDREVEAASAGVDPDPILLIAAY